MPSPNPLAPPVTIAVLPSSCITVQSSSTACDIGIKSVTAGFTTEKGLNQCLWRALSARRENRLPVTTPDLGAHQLALERRQHVECEHLRPHVPVVARGIATHQVAEACRQHRSVDVAQPCLTFQLGPGRHRCRRGATMQLHVIGGVLALSLIANALSVLARRIELCDLRAGQARATRTDLRYQAEGFLASRPLL